MPHACPTPQLLASYLAGRLLPQQADDIEEHLQVCERCVELAEKAQAGRDVLLQAVALPVPGDSLADEPELASALAAIQGYSTSDDDDRAGIDRDTVATRLVRDYQILDKLGEGGMGAVYRALHTRLEKVVALKILKPDRQQQAQAVQRFEREMRALGSLEHPNIVRALDAGEADGKHFLVMEFIQGIDLARLVQRLGPLAIADACELVRQAALGLGHAHQHEKVHRDVKPANLMLSTDGVVKVLDLGLAQLRSPLAGGDELTRDDQVMGTRAYMSPEQLMGAKNVTHATDIYSLGVTLHHLLAGEIPLKPGQFALHLPPLEQLRAAVPGPVKQVVQAMLCRTVDDRVASMASVAALLEPHAAGANLPNLLRRFDDSHVRDARPRGGDGALGLDSFALPSALHPTEPFQTTDRRPPAPPPLPPPVVKHARPMAGRSKALLLGGVGLAAVIAVAGALLLFRTPPVALGTLTLRDDRPAAEGHRRADVFVIPVARRADEAVEPIALAAGDNSLSVGEYRLHGAAQGLVLRVNGQSPPPTFFVRADQPLQISVAVAAARGVLHLQVGHSLMNEALDEIKGPGIFAVPREALDQIDAIRLHAGENELPAGEYRLLTPAWMLEFTVNGQPAPQMLVVKRDRPLYVRGTVRTDFPWNLPEIPTTPGAFAEAYGTLWRASAAGEANELTYHLRLTVRDEVKIAGAAQRWLEVEVTTLQAGEKFVERGYLLIDAAHYRDDHELRVARGWIEAANEELRQQLASLYAADPPAALVVPFDSQHDALAELAQRQNLVFPADRVSVQEAMALLFEADFVGGLPAAVQELRPRLAALRKLHLESVDGPFGAETCLVVSAQIDHPTKLSEPPLVRYELKRAADVPFSFLSIQVESASFRGKFTLKDYKRNSADGAPVAVDETRLQQWADVVAATPSVRQRFDIVSLPAAAGAKSRYSGRLAAPIQFFEPRAKQRTVATIDYDVDLWVSAAEQVGKVAWRPLAVVVHSGPSGSKASTERAWLWIDDQRYRERLGLVVDPARSFVEIGGDVFPYDADDEAVVDNLHRLGSPPAMQRIGIYDALALLCDAGHPAAQKFNVLRADITAAIIASGQPRKNESIRLRLDDGTEPWGERWQPPLGTLVYRIDRVERELPFGIHTVFLQSPTMHIDFTAEVKSFANEGSALLVEGDRWWEQHARQTAERIAAIKPGNFRLWKRDDDSVIAWAEYLADGHNHVALRDAGGRIVTERIESLARGQQATMRVRQWRNRAGDRSFQAEFKGVEGNKWRLWTVPGAKVLRVDPLNYSTADAQWVADQSSARETLDECCGP